MLLIDCILIWWNELVKIDMINIYVCDRLLVLMFYVKSVRNNLCFYWNFFFFIILEIKLIY